MLSLWVMRDSAMSGHRRPVREEMIMRLNGRVALVTGASRGIGFAVAKLFAQEGAIVYPGSSSNPDGIFPAGVTGVELDVSKQEHWKPVVAASVAAHGRVETPFACPAWIISLFATTESNQARRCGCPLL